jgi:hypothetical protein
MNKQRQMRWSRAAVETPVAPFKVKLRENSLEGIPGTSVQMAKQAESERRRWRAVVEASGARAQ